MSVYYQIRCITCDTVFYEHWNSHLHSWPGRDQGLFMKKHDEEHGYPGPGAQFEFVNEFDRNSTMYCEMLPSDPGPRGDLKVETLEDVQAWLKGKEDERAELRRKSDEKIAEMRQQWGPKKGL